MNIKFSTKVVMPDFDPTEVKEARITLGPLVLTSDAFWDQARIRVVLGRHVVATTRFQKLAWCIMDFAEQYDQFSNKMFGMWLENKLPMKAKQTLCVWFGHAWHYEEEGDVENGPMGIDVWCLRCGAGQDYMNGDVVAVTYVG